MCIKTLITTGIIVELLVILNIWLIMENWLKMHKKPTYQEKILLFMNWDMRLYCILGQKQSEEAQFDDRVADKLTAGSMKWLVILGC